jgi:hypothetical protein
VVASGELVIKGFHFLDSTAIKGWLLLVDPESLKIDVQQSEASSEAGGNDGLISRIFLR